MNSNLSIVVLTQNKRCNIIPRRNSMIAVFLKEYSGNNLLTRYALTIVSKTSTTAMFKNLYECIPLLTSPNIFL